MEEFIPEVRSWKRSKQLATKRAWWPRKKSFQQQQGHLADDSAVASAAKAPLAASFTDAQQLYDCVSRLQSHFHARRSEVPVAPALVNYVLAAIDRVLPFAELPTEDYLRGVLRVGEEEALADAIRRRPTDTNVRSSTELEYKLRGLLEVIHT